MLNSSFLANRKSRLSDYGTPAPAAAPAPTAPTIPGQYTAADFQMPAGFGKSARETKMEMYDAKIAGGLASYGNEAYGLKSQEEGRGAAAEQIIRDANQRADVPTITDAEIARRFSAQADKASSSFMDQASQIRDYAGSSGVTGGGEIAGVSANAQLQRLAQLTSARGDLMSFKATSDALDRQKMFDRATTLAGAVNRPVSMLGVDFQNQALQTRLAQLGVEYNRQSAKYAADASKPGLLDYVKAATPIAAAAFGGA